MTPATSNLDPWEYQYLRGMAPEYLNTIAWTDPEAVGRYPHFWWVYDKYELSQRMGVKSWDLALEIPDEYPVFIKPRYNLWGMGRDAYKVNEVKYVPKDPHFMAQEYLKGGHLSTDFVIFNSEIVDHFTFIGHKDLDGSFIQFESSYSYAEEAYLLAEIVCHHGLGHGILNVETIRGKVIEAHLRPSTQFFDICGRMLQQALVCFYKDKEYIPRSKRFEKTFSQVLRMKSDAIVHQKYTPGRISGVRSVQHCWEKGLPLSACAQDTESYRFAVVNGNDMNAIDDYSLRLMESLQFRYL